MDSVDLERLTGRVLITGTARMEFVTLQIDGGGAVNLSGVLRPELQRLSGAMSVYRPRSWWGLTTPRSSTSTATAGKT